MYIDKKELFQPLVISRSPLQSSQSSDIIDSDFSEMVSVSEDGGQGRVTPPDIIISQQ